jgi:hypothetical protein
MHGPHANLVATPAATLAGCRPANLAIDRSAAATGIWDAFILTNNVR